MAVEKIEFGRTDVEAAGCACCSTAEAPAAPSAFAGEGITATVQVSGMTCGHCASSVTAGISALDGVSGVDVDLRAGGVSTVTIRGTGPLDAVAVAEAVREAGYAVVP